MVSMMQKSRKHLCSTLLLWQTEFLDETRPILQKLEGSGVVKRIGLILPSTVIGCIKSCYGQTDGRAGDGI